MSKGEKLPWVVARRGGHTWEIVSMKRILVVGRNGQVASELARTLPTLGEVLCAGRELADATQPAKVRALVQDLI